MTTKRRGSKAPCHRRWASRSWPPRAVATTHGSERRRPKITGETSEEQVAGGELIDLGTFVGDPPEHIDPALNITLDAYQVVNALYDGLTEIDATDPENPESSSRSWPSPTSPTRTPRSGRSRSSDDANFSDGEPVLPSSFQRAWERASDPDFAGDYSYLMSFIEGGEEKLDGEADTLSGVDGRRRGDDPHGHAVARPTPTSTPVAGFQLFFPMPAAVDELERPERLGERRS